MTFLRFFLLVIGSLAVGCSDPSKLARQRLSPETAGQLRKEAAQLHDRHFAKGSLDFLALKAPEWPAVAKQLGAQRIALYPDGVAIALQGNAENESGIHVVPEGKTSTPASNPRVRYEPIYDGVFWYEHRR